MNILILGSGGREHALAWKIAGSPLADRLYCAPGNAGIAREAQCVALDVADHAAVIAFCQSSKIDLVVVGPEVPLCAGIVDDLEAAGIKAFGPSKWAARLEGSKGFTKDLCKANKIPTAAYERFKGAAAAKDYVRKHGAPIVVKADGLAAGKGVVVAETIAEAEAAIDMMFTGGLGQPAWEIVIEDCLVGEEASFFALCDGDTAIALVSAQDHKRVGDGDKGPNTGGMGAYSPAPVVTPQLHARVLREVIQPVVRGMEQEGITYTGFLYAGLMIDAHGNAKVLEFNCRMGDPETQPIMLRLKSDFAVIVEHAINGTLDQVEVEWDRRTALGVVLAAANYPDTPRKGDVISGLPAPRAKDLEDAHVFHAGTAMQDGKVVTNGGRVLCVTALGTMVKMAQKRAYEIADGIRFDGCQMRRDIGWRAISAHRK